jgi:hypothetical protein
MMVGETMTGKTTVLELMVYSMNYLNRKNLISSRRTE